jgi:hypothetical protein
MKNWGPENWMGGCSIKNKNKLIVDKTIGSFPKSF